MNTKDAMGTKEAVNCSGATEPGAEARMNRIYRVNGFLTNRSPIGGSVVGVRQQKIPRRSSCIKGPVSSRSALPASREVGSRDFSTPRPRRSPYYGRTPLINGKRGGEIKPRNTPNTRKKTGGRKGLRFRQNHGGTESSGEIPRRQSFVIFVCLV